MAGNKAPYETLTTAQVTAQTTPTLLVAASLGGIDDIKLANMSTSELVYVGGPNVSTSTGFPLTLSGTPGSVIDICVTNGLYAISVSGTAQIAVMTMQ